MRLDELTPLEFVHLMNTEDSRVLPAVASQAEAIAQAITIVAERLAAGGRLIYIGSGTSGRLGVLDATECPPTFNSPPEQVVGIIAGGQAALTRAVEGAEDHPEAAEQDLQRLGLNSKDVLVGIATSGRTPYVLGAVSYAKRQGAYTIGLTCNADAELNPVVDLAITPVVGPEVLSGSTRLKAGTATKLVLNMLSTGAMVRLGKTYGNLMVDLRATNSKLRARANRIVRILTELSVEDADALLKQCGGELKTALVAHLGRLNPDEARCRLQAAGGQVRKALEAAGKLQPLTPDPSPQRAEREPIAPVSPLVGDEGKAMLSRTEHPSQLVLGIDGGGSHTVALLASARWDGVRSRNATEGVPRTLGRGEAGPSNLQAVGSIQAFAALDEAVAKAFAAAGLTRRPVASACLGLAGADRPDDQRLILGWAARVKLADKIEVTNDAAILLAAGTPEGWGLAVIAGTGSIAFGRNPEGHTARAGGWGYLFGDEGSGYALTVAALQAVARALDGRGPATALRQTLFDKLGLSQAGELIRAVYGGTWDRASLASLAPLVLEAAGRDAVAEKIVDQGAQDLAWAAAVVVDKLALAGRHVPLVLAGGVLLASESYRSRVLRALNSLGVQAGPVALVNQPAEGAVRRALKALSLAKA